MGCASPVPRDVAHVQFRARVAFKLVWCPGADGEFASFVLVDDAGELLATGTPTGALPPRASIATALKVLLASDFEQLLGLVHVRAPFPIL